MDKNTKFQPVYGSESSIEQARSIAGKVYFSSDGKIYLDIGNNQRILIANKSVTKVYEQKTAEDTWEITHKMGKYPSVTVIDNDGNELVGDVNYISPEIVSIHFSQPCLGRVYLN